MRPGKSKRVSVNPRASLWETKQGNVKGLFKRLEAFQRSVSPSRNRLLKLTLHKLKREFKKVFLKAVSGKLKRDRVLMLRLKQLGLSYSQLAEAFAVSVYCIHYDTRIPRAKKISKSEVCQRCGGKDQLQAHHTNYVTEDFEVLCGICHSQEQKVFNTTI